MSEITKPAGQHFDRPASASLLTYVADAGSTNCLAQAARTARDGLDEIVFLAAEPRGQQPPGHVALRDIRTGALREPGAPAAVAGMQPDAYAATHRLTLICAVPTGRVRGVLGAAPALRAAALAAAGAPLSSIAACQFAGVPGVNPADPKYDVPDKDVHAWLDALGAAVSDQDKKALAQTGDDAHTVKAWFDAHKRGDPALNNMPQNVADAENRLFANDAVGKQLTDGGLVTRDAVGKFMDSLDSAARSATESFQSFESNNTNLGPDARGDAAYASILQADLPVLDAAGSSNAKVDQKFNADDLKAIAAANASLPDPLKRAAAHYADPGAFSALNHTQGGSGDGTVTDSNFATLLSDGVGLSRQDTHVRDWLDSLGSAVSDEDKALAQIGDDVTTVKAWFDAHDRGDPALNTMPKNVADAEKRLFANDAVGRQLTVDGLITRDGVGDFLKRLDDSADSAKGSFQSFQKDNPNADPVALQQAVAASILQANVPVLDAAGSSNAKVDQKFNLDDLKAVAAGAGLPDPLRHAASLYANAGEFGILAGAGLDASTLPNGLVQNSNLDSLLSKSTSKSEADTIARLKSDALRQAVLDAGGDARKVNGDYFNGGHSNATGADKAAALLQLSQTIARYKAGQSQFRDGGPDAYSSPDQFHQSNDGPTPGEQSDQFLKDMQGRIDTLSKDKDVQSFLSDKLPGTMQSMVAGDPALKAALQKQFDAASSTKALQDALNPKDISTSDALSSFLAKANVYAQALGMKPEDANAVFSKALADAPPAIRDQVKQAYDDITSGKTIDSLIKGGTPQDKAIIQAAVDKTLYDSVLDKDSVQAGTDKFTETTAKLARAQLTDGMSVDDMLKGLSVSGVDDPRLLQLIQDNLDKLAAPGPNQPTAATILAAIRQVVDTGRGTLKFDDAMAKVQKDWKPVVPAGVATDAYKAGVFHGASAVLLAGALCARIAGGGGSNLQTAQETLGVAGLLTEGGAKYYGTTLNGLNDTVKGDKTTLDKLKAFKDLPGFTTEQGDELAKVQAKYDTENASLKSLTDIGKDVENVGKSVGGVAGNALGLVLGAIGAKNAAGAGDIGGAAAQGTFAGLNGISVIAGVGEVAAYVLPRVGALAATESLAALGGVFGAVAGAVGVVAAVGGLIYLIVESVKADQKKQQQEGDWYKELQDGFAPSGLTLPSLDTLVAPRNGIPPDNGPAD